VACWNSSRASGKLGRVLEFDRNSSTNGLRIRAALEASGRASDISPEIGGLARALAASKQAGTFLCIGAGAGEIGAWVLDAMDYSSGLVILVQDESEARLLEREFDRDVRASVHLQEVESFLTDVRAHRFELIVDLLRGAHPAIVRLALGALAAGGIYLGWQLVDPSSEGGAHTEDGSQRRASLFEPADFEAARIGARGDAWLLVRRTQPRRPERRARESAPSAGG